MRAYVPNIDDSLIPKWVDRLNTLNMRCEIHPTFSFGSHSGFLPFKIVLEKSAQEQFLGAEYLTGFEFYLDDFNLEREVEALRPKKTFLERISSKTPKATFFASEEIDVRLRSCTKVLSFVWGSADTFELRMAMLSALVLAELTGGVAAYPADGIWYTQKGDVEKALVDAEEYEGSLRPSEINTHKFEEWL